MAISRKNRTGDKVAASVGSPPRPDGRTNGYGDRWSGITAINERQGLSAEVPAGQGFTATEYAEHFTVSYDAARMRLASFARRGMLLKIGKRNREKVYDTPAAVGKPNGRKL